MMERGSGSIVNLSSSVGWMASNDGEAHYCAAKAGIMGFTRAVAAEVAGKGIRVNAIAPGVIYNEFLSRVYPPEFFENWKRRTLLGRLGDSGRHRQPRDVPGHRRIELHHRRGVLHQRRRLRARLTAPEAPGKPFAVASK